MPPLPSAQLPPSRSQRRRQRRQKTMQRLFAAATASAATETAVHEDFRKVTATALEPPDHARRLSTLESTLECLLTQMAEVIVELRQSQLQTPAGKETQETLPTTTILTTPRFLTFKQNLLY